MPNFLILNSGVAAGNTAQANGVKLTFGSFALGAGVNYTPAITDTGLAGAVVYTAPITSVVTYNAEAVDVMLSIPAGAGPFDYGEVVIYLDTGVPYAKLVYTSLQPKLQTTAGSGGSTIVIHAILKIVQGVGIINIISGATGKIPVYGDFSSITTPSLMSGDPYEALVFEPTVWGQPVHLVRQSNNYWVPEDYTLTASLPITAVNNTGAVTIVGAPFFGNAIFQQNNEAPRQYLIADGNGNLCCIQAFVGSEATLVRRVSWLSVGTQVNIYRATYMINNPDQGIPGRMRRGDVKYNGAGMIGYNSGLSYDVGTVGQRLNADIINTQRLYDALRSLEATLSPVGSITAAMVFPSDFEASGHWKWCDGQGVVCDTPDLQEYKVKVGAVLGIVYNVVPTPDLRGLFLRGIGGGANGMDPDLNRALNSLQLDEFKSHNHANGNWNSLLLPPNTQNTPKGYDTSDNEINMALPQPILPAGGAETRPKNRGVHYFIRIRSATYLPLV